MQKDQCSPAILARMSTHPYLEVGDYHLAGYPRPLEQHSHDGQRHESNLVFSKFKPQAVKPEEKRRNTNGKQVSRELEFFLSEANTSGLARPTDKSGKLDELATKPLYVDVDLAFFLAEAAAQSLAMPFFAGRMLMSIVPQSRHCLLCLRTF